MVIFRPKAWVKPLWKNVNFSTFLTSCFYSPERSFLVVKYRKRHLPGLYCLKKKSLEKWPFLDQNHGLTRLKKCRSPSNGASISLISWVNFFPSRFINRTASFARKVSYFRESRVSPHREKIKLDEVELRSSSFGRFPFFLYVYFYNFTAAGIWVSWNKTKISERWKR